MTEVRARIAEALREALRYLAVLNQSSTKPPDAQWDIVSDHLTDVLLALDGIAVVALPESDDENAWHIEDVGYIAVNTEFCGGGVRLLNLGFDLTTTVAEARVLAAALLAAAAAAVSEQATE